MDRRIAVLRLTGVGFFIGGSIALGVIAGLWLDNRFDTSLFWIVGLFLGLVVASYGVYQMLLPFISKKRDEENG